MDHTHRNLFKILSILMLYPDSRLKESLDEVDEATSGLEPEYRQIIESFTAHIANTSNIKLISEYTNRFDFDPETSLNLSFHKYGDGRARGPAMARLNGMYKEFGYENGSCELPDYLPLVLEFMSVCPDEAGKSIVSEYGCEVTKLQSNLEKAHSCYAGLMGIVVNVFNEYGVGKFHKLSQ